MMRNKKTISTKLKPAGEHYEQSNQSIRDDDDKLSKNVDVISIYLNNGEVMSKESQNSSSRPKLILKSHNPSKSGSTTGEQIRHTKTVDIQRHTPADERHKPKYTFISGRKYSNKNESDSKILTKTSHDISHNSLFDSERIEGYGKRITQNSSGRTQILNSVQTNLFPSEINKNSFQYSNQKQSNRKRQAPSNKNILINDSFNPVDVSIDEKLNSKYPPNEQVATSGTATPLNSSFQNSNLKSSIKKTIPSAVLNLQLAKRAPIVKSVDRRIGKRNNLMSASQEFGASIQTNLISSGKKKAGQGMYISMKEQLSIANSKLAQLNEANMKLISENHHMKLYLGNIENELKVNREKINGIIELQQHVIKLTEENNFL